ncbi:MAG TPA: glycine dehydrogenase, partial [Candidatus Hydrogenedentes bacterium]|nr:glycine dehydrogenase [Candidatus Hydrogenedentota bacterium]
MGWIPTADAERFEMLDAIGAPDLDTLFEPIPESVRLKSWEVPPGQSEMAVRDLMARIAGRNTAGYVSFLGGGYYDHFIPAAVDALASRSEFYTAYTPYQPEISQGRLEA